MVETGDRLAAIRARVGGATPGPWTVDVNSYGDELWFGGEDCYLRTVEGPDAALGGDGQAGQSGPDADFIAHAREDVPWLLVQVIELRRALDMALRDDPEWCAAAHDALCGPRAPGDGS